MADATSSAVRKVLWELILEIGYRESKVCNNWKSAKHGHFYALKREALTSGFQAPVGRSEG